MAPSRRACRGNPRPRNGHLVTADPPAPQYTRKAARQTWLLAHIRRRNDDGVGGTCPSDRCFEQRVVVWIGGAEAEIDPVNLVVHTPVNGSEHCIDGGGQFAFEYPDDDQALAGAIR